MSCSQTLSGLTRDCASNAGGIKAIYIANIDDVTGVTMDTGGSKINTITMASSAKFKGYYFKRGQASLTITPQFNEAGDYAGEQAVVSVNFSKMDTTKRVQMAALSVGELAIMVLDNNGLYWYLGKDHAVLRTGGESTPGQAATDFNHYGMEFTANDNELPFEVASAGATAVIG